MSVFLGPLQGPQDRKPFAPASVSRAIAALIRDASVDRGLIAAFYREHVSPGHALTLSPIYQQALTLILAQHSEQPPEQEPQLTEEANPQRSSSTVTRSLGSQDSPRSVDTDSGSVSRALGSQDSPRSVNTYED
jgi:hypothetical protein